MSTRVQVILDEEEREVFRHCAQQEGLSLSAWLRRAAQERAAGLRKRGLATLEDLSRFFEACDRRETGRGPEPDWQEHLEVMRQSRSSGLPPA